MVEFSPTYWVTQPHRLVKMIKPSGNDIYSVVTRAQIASKQWVASEQS